MTPYGDKGGNSGVVAYDLGDGHIDVGFEGGSVYRYTAAFAGPENIAEMARLAQEGKGLNSFIIKRVRRRYSARLR